MGRAAENKKRFLKQHPKCCFCGGEREATTTDHIPSRAVFVGRNWPEGYEYPACIECNRDTAQDEQVVALISRFGLHDPRPGEDKELEKLLLGIRNNNPNVLRELQLRPIEVKRFLRNRDMELPQGMTTKEYPAVKLSGPLVTAAIERFARKLFLSLHYKHTNQIVTSSGGITIRWLSNGTKLSPEVEANFIQIIQNMPGSPEIRRSGEDISDQFKYRYAVVDGSFSAYMVWFRNTLAMFGIVKAFDRDFPEAMIAKGLYEPFARAE